MFYFPFPADAIQCLQMNDLDRYVHGFKTVLIEYILIYRMHTNHFPVYHLLQDTEFAVVLALNIQCLWLCC